MPFDEIPRFSLRNFAEDASRAWLLRLHAIMDDRAVVRAAHTPPLRSAPFCEACGVISASLLSL